MKSTKKMVRDTFINLEEIKYDKKILHEMMNDKPD
jgi:hypothetical protein